ncbi:MAG: hypothetical protein ACOX5R_15760 [bacterium]|jgi:hypothetical protein
MNDYHLSPPAPITSVTENSALEGDSPQTEIRSGTISIDKIERYSSTEELISIKKLVQVLRTEGLSDSDRAREFNKVRSVFTENRRDL